MCVFNCLIRLCWRQIQDKRYWDWISEESTQSCKKAYQKCLYLFNKTNKCTRVIQVLSHVINYQHVLIISVFIRVAIETCWWLLICDKTCFTHVHLLALLNKFKYLFNAQTWNILRCIRKYNISILRRVSGHTIISL